MSKTKPSTRIKCFMLHETDRAWRFLRRYNNGEASTPCKSTRPYHNAQIQIATVSGFTKDAEGCWMSHPSDEESRPPNTDPRWPTSCDSCSYVFTHYDAFQVYDEHIFVTDDNREFSIRNAPPGAMWYADWMGENYFGHDGHCLVVRCPDGREWMIDGPASNCTMKNDRGPYDKAHRCWVRHGTAPLIVVDKKGRTCAAGGGSIDTKHKYHGFLGSHGAQPGEFT